MEGNEYKALNELFKQLSEGQTPNFAQMMAAISDISTIYPEPDEPCDPSLCLQCG